MESKPYADKTYLAMALDPIHVGTGGYRLGRVDNTIVREPATNIPKIPGTSIAGVARAYTAMKKLKYRWKEGNTEYCCAGKGGEQGEKHCGKPNCPVCVPYGFSNGETGTSFQGLAHFSDARILFFPVASMIGPVWVTSPMRLKAAGVSCDGIKPEDWLQLDSELCDSFTSPTVKNKHLNLGWLYLPRIEDNEDNKVKLNGEPIAEPSQWRIKSNNLTGVSPEILSRIVIVSDRLFSHVVNDNLETRTSVAIDPATGAAESGALFTYEAIPRGTILWFEVVYNDPALFKVPVKNGGKVELVEIKKEDNQKADIDWLKANVETGLGLFEFLGVGGMGTRGMGRMKILNSIKEENNATA